VATRRWRTWSGTSKTPGGPSRRSSWASARCSTAGSSSTGRPCCSSATGSPTSSGELVRCRRLACPCTRWFRRTIGQEAVPTIYDYDTDEDADFDTDGADWDTDLAHWQAECEAARKVAASYGLDHLGKQRKGNDVSLRWVYTHMIEEYARHNGHADLIRELIDGAVGY
jgi:hypothetical protein